MPAGASRDHDPAVAIAAHEPGSQCLPHLRDEQREPNRIREESRGEQQSTRHQDHRAVGQGPARHRAFGQLEAHLEIRLAALAGHQRRAEERRENHQCESGPEPDHLAHPEEKGDLDERDDQEGDEQDSPNPHLAEDTGLAGLLDKPT